VHVVKVQHIASGQRLAKDIVNIHGQTILSAGTVVESRHTTLLKAWGIAEVFISDDTVTLPAIGPSSPSVPPNSNAPPLAFAVDESTHPALVEIATVAARLGPKSGPAKEPVPPPLAVGTPGRESGRPRWPAVSPETVAGRARTLVSLPTIYFQVERVINHPSSSSTDIAKVLRSDQGLSARLLRIANSAFYGFPQRVESVDQAVRIIGTRQLHDLVLATVVLTQFRGVDARLVTMKSFWTHSFACGIAARSLATLRREGNTERFFVAGLLHDIGSLVLYQEFPERAQAALEEHGRSRAALDEVEASMIGCDHGQVGAALMTSWKLPELYREIAAYHHRPSSRSRSVGTSVVHLADLLVAALGLGSNGEVGVPRFCAEAWDVVGLPLSSVGRVAEEVLGLIEGAMRLFMDD
jgi:putative nucleotidyltransferase with HDIG domain